MDDTANTFALALRYSYVLDKKFRIREKHNLSTDADSSTDTCFPAAAAKGAGNHFVLIVGIPKNTKY